MDKKVNSYEIGFFDSIKTKLIFIMALLVAVPLIIAVVISYNTSTTKAKNDALSLLESNANFVETKFADIVNKNVIALQTFATAPSTVEYIRSQKSGEQLIPTEAVLAQMDAINANIADGNDSCILSLASGDQLIRTDREENVSIADREYFQRCVSTKSLAVSDIVVSKARHNRITIIIVPIFDDQSGELIGTIQRSFNLEVLHEFLSTYVKDGFIADTKGIVAAHSKHEISADDEAEDRSDAPFMETSDMNGHYKAKIDGKLTYITWVKEPVTGYTMSVSETDDEIMAEARQSAMIILIIGVLMLVIATVTSFVVSKSFTDPIKDVGNSLIALADGRFDPSDRYVSRKDEFGAISKATNSVIVKLDDIVTNIKLSAYDVTTSSESLSETADQISKTAEDVSNAVQEVASGATQQANEIQQATESVGEIGKAVGEVKTSAESLSDITEKMKEASEVSGQSLVSLQKSSSAMTEKIDEISKTIQSTQKAVDNISEKVEGITSIATQTNLLSLNASIEAARAGEAGKGFAVVAEEIGKLAEDSRQMAGDIRKEMDILLEQSSAAVQAAEDVRQGNNNQRLALGETLEAVNGMLADIESTVAGVGLISNGADTCETSKDTVVDAMDALSAISEENAASSEETGASMEELSATVTTLAESANSLKGVAEKLNDEMKFFKDHNEEG